jgi:predicted Ser/Thr protein kinase
MQRELNELLLDWEERRESGDATAPDLLRADDPEDEAELRRRARLLDACDRLLLGAAPETGHPARVGPYEVCGVLGRGGMGVVYAGWDPDLQRPVALKMLSPLSSLVGPRERDRLTRRFSQEAQVLAQLKHPHIVPVYAATVQDGHPCFVMEWVAGGSLATHRKRLTDRGPQAIAAFVEKVARAVHHAHEHGVLHRDLKPANILLGEDGEPLVGDFGLAKLLGKPGLEDEPTRPAAATGDTQPEASLGLTLSGQAPGTPTYMAPEQFEPAFGPVSPATDVWALGVILYELLTGHKPFGKGSREELLAAACHAVPARPGALERRVDRHLEAIVLRCLEKQPQRRYASSADLAEDLGRWRRGEPTRARPAGRARRAWRGVRRYPLAAAAAVLLGCLAASVFVVRHLTDPERPLRALEDTLARGQPVQLLGETGGPAWSAPALGSGILEAPSGPDAFLTINALDPVLVELLRDPQGSYRLSAEVRHRNSSKGDVGLYFAYSRLPTLGAPRCYCTLTFNDFEALFTLPDGTRRSRVDVSVHQHRPANLLRFDCALCGEYFLPAQPAAKPGPNPWRHLAVEVTPQGIEAFWEARPIGRVARRDLVQRFKEFHLAHDPRPDGEPPFGPRQALGLYVNYGMASFRNVTVQPLR